MVYETNRQYDKSTLSVRRQIIREATDILGIDDSFTERQARSKWMQIVAANHPDKFGGVAPEYANEKMRQANWAFGIYKHYLAGYGPGGSSKSYSSSSGSSQSPRGSGSSQSPRGSGSSQSPRSYSKALSTEVRRQYYGDSASSGKAPSTEVRRQYYGDQQPPPRREPSGHGPGGSGLPPPPPPGGTTGPGSTRPTPPSSASETPKKSRIGWPAALNDKRDIVWMLILIIIGMTVSALIGSMWIFFAFLSLGLYIILPSADEVIGKGMQNIRARYQKLLDRAETRDEIEKVKAMMDAELRSESTIKRVRVAEGMVKWGASSLRFLFRTLFFVFFSLGFITSTVPLLKPLGIFLAFIGYFMEGT